MRLRDEPLTAELLKEAKRIEFPDTVISRFNRTQQKMKLSRCVMIIILYAAL